jgi:hypothetical protein
MALKPKAVLTDASRTFVVQALACFDSPGAVAIAVKKEFDIVITPQAVEAYDPTKRAGRNLSNKWKVLFEATRKAFIEDASTIGIANKSVRLRMIGRIADRAESVGNTVVALQAIEQAAKEVGGAFTNRRELTGKDGSPLPAAPIIVSTMTPQQAAEAYADTLNGDG